MKMIQSSLKEAKKIENNPTNVFFDFVLKDP